MSTPRFHIPVPLTLATTLNLPEAAAHHAARVLRLRSGDAVTLFNGQGGEYAARITAIGKHDVTVAIERHDPVEQGFRYNSGNNPVFLTPEQIRELHADADL